MHHESSLPGGFIASLEFVHPREIAALLSSDERPKFQTLWYLKNEVRPSDIYCYLGARFGQPNGMQNFLRNDDSNNLIHWEWFLRSPTGYLIIAGLNFRTDVWVTDGNLSDLDKGELVRQLKESFSEHGKGMQAVRKTLEPWIEFVNPYQRLNRAVSQLVADLDALNLDPEKDSLLDIIDSNNREATLSAWKENAKRYTRAVGLSFGIRSMVPVMAEAFVNLLLFILARPAIKVDKQLYDSLFRQPMHVRVRSLPYFCLGFTAPIDSHHADVLNYLKLIDSRNDLLHGNISIEKLKFNEVLFFGKVPIFNSYTSMWDRSLGVMNRAVGFPEVHSELQAAHAFTEYLVSLLDEKTALFVRAASGKFDLGIRQDTGRLGILFSDTLVDFVMAGEDDGPNLDGKNDGESA